jgi:hypothetical protein
MLGNYDFSLMEKSRRHHAECSDEGETNMKALRFCVVMVSTVLMASSTWADSLYRCADGTFTNKAERQCPLYEPKGIVQVQSKLNDEQAGGSTTSEAERPFAEAKLFDESAKKRSAGR